MPRLMVVFMLLQATLSVFSLPPVTAEVTRELLQEGRTVVEIGADNAESFAKAVKTALPNSTIHISADIQLPSLIAIEIDGLTILGNEQAPPTIRCASPEGGFEVRSTSVVFRHLIIRDCNEAAIEVLKPSAPESKKRRHRRNGESGTDLELDDVTITGVSVLKRDIFSSIPGAAVALHDGTRTKIDGCRFIGNNGTSGGAIFFSGAALLITRTTFVENSAKNSGGAIHAVASAETGGDGGRVHIRESVFERNNVLNGFLDRSRQDELDPTDVNSSPFIRIPFPGLSGGAIAISYQHNVSIENSVFSSNTAVPAGGAIYIGDNTWTWISGCQFLKNLAVSTPESSLMLEAFQGGAILVSFSESKSQLSIVDSVFTDNCASFGGALNLVGPSLAEIMMHNVRFIQNKAAIGGGAIAIQKIERMRIESALFASNHAFAGGAILVANRGSVTIVRKFKGQMDPLFYNNTAVDGGAIFAVDANSISTQKTEFKENRAKRNGGAVCFVNSASGRFTGQRLLLNGNSAQKGGAIFVENIDHITFVWEITDEPAERLSIEENHLNRVTGNVAEAGGAIYFRASSVLRNRMILDTSVFQSNKVFKVLPVRYAFELDKFVEEAVGIALIGSLTESESSVRSDRLLRISSNEPCHPGGGGAICLILNGLPERSEAQIKIFRSNFTDNRAEVGGALLFATGRGSKWEATCSIEARGAVSDIVSGRCRSVELLNVIFAHNVAAQSGGAVFASNMSHIHYSASKSSDDVQEYATLGTLPSTKAFVNNRLEQGSYGYDIAGQAVWLRIVSPQPDKMSGLLLANQSGGLPNVLTPIAVAVFDARGQIIDRGIVDSRLMIISEARREGEETDVVSGQTSVIAKNGIATFMNLSVSSDQGRLKISFSASRRNVQKTSAMISVRNCSLGERKINFVCEACPRDTFLFYSTSTHCSDCPAHAECFGKASVVPVADYWHSGLFSIKMYRCFHGKACNYEDRVEQLHLSRELLTGSISSPADVSSLHNLDDVYRQCADGYTGPLCGSCAERYGHIEGKFCAECHSKQSVYVIIFALAVGQLLVISLTLRSALSAIRDMNELQVLNASVYGIFESDRRQQTYRDVALHDSSIIDIQANPEGGAGFPTEPTPSIAEIFARKRAERDQQLRAKLIIASQHISEIIKIFINFMQVTSIAGSIDLDRSSSLNLMLKSMNSISGFANGATFAPITCLLDSSTAARSVHGVVVRVALHACLSLFLVLIVVVLKRLYDIYSGVKKTENHDRSSHSMPTLCFLVVAFFGFQSVSEDLMGTVSCIELNSDELTSNNRVYDPEDWIAAYSRLSPVQGRYWTEDTAVKCWTGMHMRLALFLGIPGIALFVFGVPFWLFCFLLDKRRKNQLLDIDVLNTYGFIYQNYEEQFVYWEVMVMSRKALMGAIIVFAYRLEPDLQGILALGILMIALVLHLISSPFKYSPLNRLESLSLVVSIVTIYSGLVFHDRDSSKSVEIVSSLLVVVLNALLVSSVFYLIFFYLDVYTTVRLKMLNSVHVPRYPIARTKLLLLHKIGELWNSVTSFTKQVKDAIDQKRRSMDPR